jgi:hypothetical protein
MLCRGLVRRGVECEVIAIRDRDDPLALSGCQNGVRLELMRSLGTVKSLSLCPAALGIIRGRHAVAKLIRQEMSILAKVGKHHNEPKAARSQ